MRPISGTCLRSGALLIGALVALAPTWAAADPRAGTRLAPGPVGAFDLHLAREDLTVEYRDGSPGGDLELTRVGIAFHEHIGRSVRGAVNLGATGVRQRDRPATADVDPTGWYFGLDFDGIWPQEGLLRFNAGVGWRYTRADRSDENGDETILDWHTSEARAAAILRLGPAVAVRLGAAQQWIRGDERFRADSSSTTRFDIDDPTSAFLQLDFLTGRGGAIRFQARAGNPKGARIAFEYNY